MKPLILLLLGAGLAPAQNSSRVTSASLDDSEVRITYGELKRLVTAAQPAPSSAEPKPKQPPLAAALLAFHCRLDTDTLEAELLVESFAEGWQLIPVAGAGAGVVTFEPQDARLVFTEGQLCLLTDKPGRQTLRLSFAPPGTDRPGALHLAPAAAASLRVTGLPEGRSLHVRHGGGEFVAAQAGTVPLPAAGGEVLLSFQETGRPPQPATTGDAALITRATYTTQVARDGSVLTEGVLETTRDQAAEARLQLPASARLLRCRVDDSTLRLTPDGGNQITVPLPAPGADKAPDGVIHLSYTDRLPTLDPAEGELELALPGTPLFARQIEWNILLPAAYELAFSGSMDAADDPPKTPGLHLRQSFCRDQQPQVRVTYRKRTSP